MGKAKASPLRNVRRSVLFSLVRDKLTFEPLGLHWVDDCREMIGGYWNAEMPETGVQWKVKLTKRYWLYEPLVKLQGVKHIHYTFPYLLGIWLHRTIVWRDGHRTHDRLQGRARYIGNKYDIAADFNALRQKLESKLIEES
jgi:hypothetical protein